MAQEVNKPTLANMTVSEFLMANKAAQGRNGDTMLAHINPREANLLQSLGGSGSVNPYTGLREFYDSSAPGGMDGGMDGSESDGGGYGGADANNVNSPNFSAPSFSSEETGDSGYGAGNALSSLAESAIAALTMGVVNPDFDGKSLIGPDRGQPSVSFGLPMVGTFAPNVSFSSKGVDFDPGLVAEMVSNSEPNSFTSAFSDLFSPLTDQLTARSINTEPVSVPVAEKTQYAVRDGDLFNVGGGDFKRPYKTGLV